MANYKVGDIIRLSRNFIGMSQEELAFQAGLATETISRIESGKHKISTETYKKIMSALNRFPERSFAICSRSDMEIIEEKKLLEEAEVKYELDDAEYYLSSIKKQIGDNEIDRQYVSRAESILRFYRNEKETKTFIEGLEQAMRLTIKDWEFEVYKEKKYPYTDQELLILMNLSSAYGEDNQCEKAMEISNMILEYLNAGYISSSEIDNFKLAIKRNLTINYQIIGEYEKSLQILQEVLEEAVALKYGSMITLTLYDIVWSMKKINQVSEGEQYTADEIEAKAKQVYYIAFARGDNYIISLLNNLLRS